MVPGLGGPGVLGPWVGRPWGLGPGVGLLCPPVHLLSAPLLEGDHPTHQTPAVSSSPRNIPPLLSRFLPLFPAVRTLVVIASPTYHDLARFVFPGFNPLRPPSPNCSGCSSCPYSRCCPLSQPAITSSTTPPLPHTHDTHRSDAAGAAHALLALVAVSAGVSGLPLELLRLHTGSCLEAIASTAIADAAGTDDHGARRKLQGVGGRLAFNSFLGRPTGSGKQLANVEGGGGLGMEVKGQEGEEEECGAVVPEGPGEAAAARFCCALLELLPPPLLAPLAERVVLPAACQVRGGLSKI